MLLQKLVHSQDTLRTDDGQNAIITHGVNEINLGGEYTICGCAIPDSCLENKGWEAVGSSFKGNMSKCDCRNCLEIIHYFKTLR